MSNRQLPWDDNRVRDRISPREVAQDNKEQLQQQNAEENQQEVADDQDDRWVPPGNSDQGSRK